MLRTIFTLLCLFLSSMAATRADQPVLVDSVGYTWSASSIRIAQSVLANAAGEGLDPDRYHVSLPGDGERDLPVLTGAVLAYMQDLSVGRSDLRAVDADIGLPPRAIDGQTLLREALRTG